MRLAAACAALLVLSSPALASGGLSCESATGPVKIDLNAGMTHGMGAPLFNFAGRVAFDAKEIGKDLRDMRFGDDDVPQYWFDGDVLQLVLYKERTDGEHGYVQLTVLTEAVGDENDYAGTYLLQAFDMTGDTTGEGRSFETEGTISCFVE